MCVSRVRKVTRIPPFLVPLPGRFFALVAASVPLLFLSFAVVVAVVVLPPTLSGTAVSGRY